MEDLSSQFMLKYLLAVMNSAIALEFFTSIRKGDTDILPDEWKQLPIKCATVEEQETIVAMVDSILELYGRHGYPLYQERQVHLQELEQQIDKMVTSLTPRYTLSTRLKKK